MRTTPFGSGGGTATSASTVSKTISQVAHGFTTCDIVRLNGTSYVGAQADNGVDAEVAGIVSSTAGADSFTLTTNGYVSGCTGLSAGTIYFLSTSTSKALTTIETNVIGTVSKPLFLADTSTSGYFFNYRGMIVSTATSSSITPGSTNYIQNVFASGASELNSAFYTTSGTISSGQFTLGVPGSLSTQFTQIGNNNFIIGYTPAGSNYTEYASCDINISTCVRLFMYPSNPGAFAQFNSSLTVDKDLTVSGNTVSSSETVTNNLTAGSLSASTGAIAGTLVNTSTINVNQINFTSGTYAATLSADQYGVLDSSGLTAGCTGFGPVVATNAGVMMPMGVCGNVNNAYGFQMYNSCATGTSANIQFIMADSSKLHYLGFQEPGNGATGTLFGITKNVGDFFFTNTLGGGVARTMVLGTVGNEDLVAGTNNAEHWRTKNTGSTIYKAGTTAAGTAPIRFTSGSEETQNETGIWQFNGNNYSLVDNSNVKHFIALTSTNATLTTNGIVLGQGTNGGWLTQKQGLIYDDVNSGNNGGFYLPALAMPTPNSSPINPGGVHYNSWIHELIGFLGGDGQNSASDSNSWMPDILSGTIFTSTAASTITNTTAESTFTLSGLVFPVTSSFSVQTNIIRANYWAPGRTLEVKAMGYYNTFNTTANIEFKLKLGTYTIGDTGALSRPVNVTSSQSWSVDGLITCISTTTATGTLGTFWTQGLVTLSSYPIAYTLPIANTAKNNVDTQVPSGINLNVIQGTTSPSENITLTNFIVDRKN